MGGDQQRALPDIALVGRDGSPGLHSVWTLWPVLEVLMPRDVYGFSTSDKFLLGTIATAFCRYLRGGQRDLAGGRNWATFGNRVANSVQRCC